MEPMTTHIDTTVTMICGHWVQKDDQEATYPYNNTYTVRVRLCLECAQKLNRATEAMLNGYRNKARARANKLHEMTYANVEAPEEPRPDIIGQTVTDYPTARVQL